MPSLPFFRHLCCAIRHCSWVGLLIANGLIFPRARGEAPPGWPSSQTVGLFVCQADAPLGDISPLLKELESLPSVLERMLSLPPFSERIHVYVFRDRAAYASYIDRYFPGTPYRRALFIRVGQQRMVFVQRGPELAIDLRHEATHALLQEVGRLPLWLDEGLAVYFETPAGKSSALYSTAAVRELMAQGQLRSLVELERLSDLGQMHRAEYGSAWAWTCFLLSNGGAGGAALREYLADLQSGLSPAPLSERLARCVASWQADFAAYFSDAARGPPGPPISTPLDRELRPK